MPSALPGAPELTSPATTAGRSRAQDPHLQHNPSPSQALPPLLSNYKNPPAWKASIIIRLHTNRGGKCYQKVFVLPCSPDHEGPGPDPRGGMKTKGTAPAFGSTSPIPRSPPTYLTFPVPRRWSFLAPSACLVKDATLYALGYLD